MKHLIPAALLALFALSSCEVCYECTKSIYDATCDCDNVAPVTFEDMDFAENESRKAACESINTCVYTATSEELKEELCGTDKEASDETVDYTEQGYICKIKN